MVDLFTQSVWEDIDRGLEGTAQRWWRENRITITSMAYDEMIGVLRNMKDKGVRAAYFSLLLSLTDEEFEMHRLGTLQELRNMAARRAALADSLLKLTGAALQQLLGSVTTAMRL